MTDDRAPPKNHAHRPNKAGVSVGILAAFLVLAVLCIILGTKVRHRDTEVANLQKQLADTKAQASKAQAELDKAKVGRR